MSVAFIPSLLPKYDDSQTLKSVRDNALTVLAGVTLIALLAQIAIPLSFTPVPITGQTLGVALVALLWGRSRGIASVAAYLGLGAAGMPVLAAGSSGIGWGPTTGYLVGMLIASFAMGTLADRGWTKTFGRTWLAAFFGSAITFACGASVLSLFVPVTKVFALGVLPFLPGDFIKTLIACFIVSKASKSVG